MYMLNSQLTSYLAFFNLFTYILTFTANAPFECDVLFGMYIHVVAAISAVTDV